MDLPEIGKRFLNDVVSSEVVGSIPFTQDEVDIKWQMLKREKAKSVMAIAVQKRTMDEHVDRVKEAGVVPGATYAEESALARAAGVPDAIVVHLGPSRESIVLVRDSTPVAVHQVTRPEEGQSSRDQAEAIARAVEQMEGYDQTIADREEAESLPLMVTGEVSSDGQVIEELRELAQRDILSVSPPVVYPEDFPIAEFSTNVGLAVVDSERPKWWRQVSDQGTSTLNLLSERHVPTPTPFVQIATFLVMLLFAVNAFNITPRVNELVGEAAAKADQLEKMEDLGRSYRLKVAISGGLQDEARGMRQMTLEMESRLAELEGGLAELGEWFQRIDTITEKTRPPTVTVSGLTPKGDQFTLSGTAPSLGDAIEYAENIRDSGLFVNVRLAQLGGGGASVTLPESGAGAGNLGLLAGLGVVGGGAPALPTAPTTQVVAPGDPSEGMLFVITATAKPSADEEGDEASE